MSELKVFTDANFEAEVLNAALPVVVDFWAPWCGPCKALGPIVEQLAGELAGKVDIGKMNVDENQKFAAQFGISGIPTILMFKGGEIVDRWIGVRPKPQIKQLIETHL